MITRGKVSLILPLRMS